MYIVFVQVGIIKLRWLCKNIKNLIVEKIKMWCLYMQDKSILFLCQYLYFKNQKCSLQKMKKKKTCFSCSSIDYTTAGRLKNISKGANSLRMYLNGWHDKLHHVIERDGHFLIIFFIRVLMNMFCYHFIM